MPCGLNKETLTLKWKKDPLICASIAMQRAAKGTTTHTSARREIIKVPLMSIMCQSCQSFPFKRTNSIIFVMLMSKCCMYVLQVQCVALYSAHMFNQGEGFVDSNLTLCDLRLSARRGLCTGM